MGDLTSPTPSIPSGSPLEDDPAYSAFDIAAVCLALHHVDDPALAIRRLAERVRPGGVLVVVDFLRHTGLVSSHPARKSVAHDGFAVEDVKKMFEDAGCGDGFAAVEMKGIEFPNDVHGGPVHKHGHGYGHGHGGHGHGSHGHGHSGHDGESGRILERRVFIARGSKF